MGKWYISFWYLEIIISYEEECEEIRGKANEVENYGQWKSEMYGRCN